MELIDTHCHIHFSDYAIDAEAAIESAHKADVKKIIVVGCSLSDSQRAVEFAGNHEDAWAAVGAHPHDGVDFLKTKNAPELLKELLGKPKVVAVGEIGLDYYHQNSPRSDQQKTLREQIEIGLPSGLPFIFHVRDAPHQKLDALQSDYRLPRSGFGAGQAWEDFWPIVDEYKIKRAIVHSFSAHTHQLDEVLGRGFLVGLNGIMTFTKDAAQLAAAKAVPSDRLILETDAPFLTPAPFRGEVCEPKHVAVTARFLADLRGEPLEQLAKTTTANAEKFFGIA